MQSLDKLKQQRDQLNARIQKLTAAEKTREKKRDTRRKILIGAYYLDWAKQHDQFDELKQRLDGYLTRNIDRELFDLPTNADTPEQTSAEVDTVDIDQPGAPN